MQFYPESDLTRLATKKLSTGEYCKPEQEVSHLFSDQWEEALQTQYSVTIDTRQGVKPAPIKQTKAESDMIEKRDDDEVTAALMTNDGSGSNDPITEGTNGDKDRLEN